MARKYLDLDHAVTAVMVPRGSGKPVPSGGGFGGQESISLGAAKPTSLPTWAAAALRRLSVPPSTLHPVVTRLANGLTLIVQTEDVSNTVSVYGHIRSQPGLEEPHGEEGVSDLLDRMFMFGSNSLHRLQFQQALDAIGASEQAGADFSLQVLPENLDRGIAASGAERARSLSAGQCHDRAARSAGPEHRGPQPESRLPDAKLVAPGALPGNRSESALRDAGQHPCPDAR